MLIIAIILSIPIYFFTISFLHELGHGIAGRLNGMELVLITVGPITFERKQSNGQLTFSWNTNLFLSGGVIALAPPKEKATKKIYFYYVLGGIISTFVFGAIFLLLAIMSIQSANNRYVAISLVILTGMSFGVGVSTCLPFEKRMTPFIWNDGKRIWEALKQSELSDLDYYAWKNAPAFLNNDAHRFNVDECRKLLEVNDPIYNYFGTFYLYLHYSAQNDHENICWATDALQKAYESLPIREQKLVKVDTEDILHKVYRADAAESMGEKPYNA